MVLANDFQSSMTMEFYNNQIKFDKKVCPYCQCPVVRVAEHRYWNNLTYAVKQCCSCGTCWPPYGYGIYFCVHKNMNMTREYCPDIIVDSDLEQNKYICKFCGSPFFKKANMDKFECQACHAIISICECEYI